MVLSVSSAYLPPANTQLTRSEQTLTANPSAQTVKALADAGPAAIYHPSEEAQATMPTLVAVDTWIGRPQSPNFSRYVDIAAGAKSALKSSFEAFQSSLAKTHPDLAGKTYGFTVEADGSLKVLNSTGQLDTADLQRLTDLLNGSDDLKAAATTFRDASIDMVDADSPWSGSYFGQYSLTKENFAKTIDLAPLLENIGSVPPKRFSDGLFYNQLAFRGERATQQTEAAMVERRGADWFKARA